MLWLALYFPQLPLEVFTRGRQQAGALAIVEQIGGRELISRCNGAAAACGIRPGLALPAALALHAALVLQPRDRVGERRALDELAAWAYQFSPRIAFEPSLLLLEVGASQRLFGGLSCLLDAVQREIGQLGYSTRHALAPSPTAAGLLARQRPGCLVSTQRDLHAAVADLPLSRLTREPAVRNLIRHIGLDTIGDALGLPRPDAERSIMGGFAFRSLARTDEQGEFVLKDVPPGRYLVSAGLRDQQGESTEFEVGPGAVRRGLRIDLVQPTKIQVTVNDREGNPVAGTAVMLQGVRSSSPGGRTDEQGKIKLVALPGTYDLMVIGPDGERIERKLTVGSTATQSLDLVLE